MKKWLITAGLVGTFVIGSLTAGSVVSFASSNSGVTDAPSNIMGDSGMMNSNQGSGMMNMMGDSSGVDMMGNMNGMMDIMSNMGDLMNDLSSETAKNLNITTDQLQNKLQSGKSLAEIAEEQGTKPDKLEKKLQKVIRKDSDQLKKNGQLTSDEQAQMMNVMSENIGIMLNAKGMFACNGFGQTSQASN